MRGYWRRSWFATKSAWSRSRKTFARLWSVEKCDCDPSNHPTTDVSNLFRSVMMYMGSLATYMVLSGADTRDVDFNCKRPILPRDDVPRRRGRQSCCDGVRSAFRGHRGLGLLARDLANDDCKVVLNRSRS